VKNIFQVLYFKQKTLKVMTILDLIKAACKTKGVPEKYAERIQKTFKIEKAEGIETFVDVFKENVIPAIQEAENEAKAASGSAAVTAYETKYNLKEGKPVETPAPQITSTSKGNDLKEMSPEMKKIFEAMQNTISDLSKKVDSSLNASRDEVKKEKARKQIEDAKLPSSWINRIDLSSDKSIEDQVKELTTEYTGIQQAAINTAVENGDYRPGNVDIPERTEAEWVKLMNGEDQESNSGTVDLGLNV